jgi:hypothetical protein
MGVVALLSQEVGEGGVEERGEKKLRIFSN